MSIGTMLDPAAEALPKYLQLVRLITERIEGGELAPGDKLPTERALGEQAAVSRVTVRAAMAELEIRGLIERRQGSGTFVAGADTDTLGRVTTGRATCLVTAGKETPYLTEVMSGCAPILGGRGDHFRLLHLADGEPLIRPDESLEHLLPQPSGLLFAGYTPSDDELRQLRAAGHRCVLFGRPIGDEPCSFYDTDNVVGAEIATAHLLDQGHRRIAYLDVHDEQWFHRDRRTGWARALTARGIEPDPALLLNGAPDYHEVRETMLRALRDDPAIDGLLVQGGVHSAAATLAIRDTGRTIGADLGVVIYDDDPEMAASHRPALTAVRQRFGESAAEAADLLLRDLATAQPPIRERIVQPSLVVRGSCGA